MKENEKNFVLLRNNLSQYKNIFQYVYSNVYPEIYCAMEKNVSTSRAHFISCLKFTRTKKKIEQLGKNPQNYENNHAKTCGFEQKPITIDEFNEAEKEEVKECIEKRKIKRRKVAEQNKL